MLYSKIEETSWNCGSKYGFEGVTDLEEEMNAQMEKDKRISEGMKSQIGVRKKRGSDAGDDSQETGIVSRSYYLDVIFVQIVLLLLLYGVCVLVVPKLPA